jgi:hypothetical protein
MSGNHQEDNFDWLVQLDYAEPEEGQDGPPASWPYPSWFNRKTGEWYYRGKPDPCPVKALGHNEAGEYIFVTALRTVRRFSSSALHGGGAPTTSSAANSRGLGGISAGGMSRPASSSAA